MLVILDAARMPRINCIHSLRSRRLPRFGLPAHYETIETILPPEMNYTDLWKVYCYTVYDGFRGLQQYVNRPLSQLDVRLTNLSLFLVTDDLEDVGE